MTFATHLIMNVDALHDSSHVSFSLIWQRNSYQIQFFFPLMHSIHTTNEFLQTEQTYVISILITIQHYQYPIVSNVLCFGHFPAPLQRVISVLASYTIHHHVYFSTSQKFNQRLFCTWLVLLSIMFERLILTVAYSWRMFISLLRNIQLNEYTIYLTIIHQWAFRHSPIWSYCKYAMNMLNILPSECAAMHILRHALQVNMYKYFYWVYTQE